MWSFCFLALWRAAVFQVAEEIEEAQTQPASFLFPTAAVSIEEESLFMKKQSLCSLSEGCAGFFR